ncbi:hypothetical protein V6Z11_D04G180500 [Gossypium hirsutum]
MLLRSASPLIYLLHAFAFTYFQAFELLQIFNHGVGYQMLYVDATLNALWSQSDGFQEFEKIRPRVSGELSPEALKYIEKLQAELSDAVEELNVEKENVQIECEKENRNDLLEYLRSLDADMVTELSQPSSVQVQETIHQLVQNILQRPFKNELKRDSGIVNKGNNHQDVADETSGTVGTSRDYLAKLLFWCMLLGHHLRGLENRLQLSCVVGLL